LNLEPFRAISFLSPALVFSLLGCATVVEETKVEFPCVVDGKQVGKYTRALMTDGTLVYVFDEACHRAGLREKQSSAQ
jgi:hypothetical protein